VILLTGFERFGANAINPSECVVNKLAPGVGASAILPVSADEAPRALVALLDRHRPEVVLSLGMAEGRPAMTLETVARNRLLVPDCESGDLEIGERPVVEGGRSALHVTLPIGAIWNTWRDAGLPCELSDSAGTFICNQVLYWSLRLAPTYGYLAGFIHLPYLPEQGEPNLPLDVMVKGVRLALQTCTAPKPSRTSPRRLQSQSHR